MNGVDRQSGTLLQVGLASGKALCVKSTSLHEILFQAVKDKNRNSYLNQVHLDNNPLKLN